VVEKIEVSESPTIFFGKPQPGTIGDNPEKLTLIYSLFRHDVPYKSFPRNHKKSRSHQWAIFFMLLQNLNEKSVMSTMSIGFARSFSILY
jgi:hypothetical protein